MWKTRVGFRVIGLGLAIFFLASCGGDDPVTSTPAPVVENGQMTPVVPTATPAALSPTALPSPTARPTRVILQDILPAALYFLQDGQIQRLEGDGVTLTQFTQEAEPITDFDVSPVDARLIYVSGNRLIEANPQYGTEIVKLDGGPVDGNDPASYITEHISSPHFSPDGSQIAFGLNGVNLVPAGDATDYTTILPSDPYPEPNNPPRGVVRFFSPGKWSPDGTKLLIDFGYWPEAGGIAIFDLAQSSLIEIVSVDPNATLCCGWTWGQGDATGYIASDLVIYASPGLTRVDASTGEAVPLAIGLPANGPAPGNPIRLFRGVYETGEDEILSFVSEPEEFGADAAYTLQRIAPDGSQFTQERADEFGQVAEVLWAQDGSGAVLRLSDADQLVWVPRTGGELLVLPVAGSQLRWAPVISQDNRQAAAEGERADTASAPGSSGALTTPTLTEDSPQLVAQSTLNLRSGPGTPYPVVGSLNPAESVAIVGVSPDHTWWQVAVTTPEGSTTAWVIGDPGLVTAQNADDMAVVIPPPPPLPIGRIFYPGYDPDGRTAIWVQDLAPGTAKQLITSDASQPSLSPDGTRLAVRSVRNDILGVGIWELATAQMSGLTSHQEDTLPRWNPNGDALVFGSTRHGDRRWRVYVTPTTSDEAVREIAFGLDPDWHPTKDMIAYKGCDAAGESCGIWTMDSQGRQQKPVTNSKSDSRPAWSPNGQLILFMSERDGNWEIYSVDAGGNVVTRLTNNPTNDGLPVVSPDGRQVAFVSNRGGEWGVWVMPIGGGSPERLLRLGVDLPNWLEQSIDWTR